MKQRTRQKIALAMVSSLAIGRQISLNGSQFFSINYFENLYNGFYKLRYADGEKIFLSTKEVYTKVPYHATRNV